MKRYEVIAHVADIRLLVEGSTPEELFNASLEGMAHIIAPGKCTKQGQNQQTITVQSMDTTTLLIDFLSSVLTQTHLKKTVFCTAVFTLLTDTALNATIYGTSTEIFDADIKAVTYHEADVVKNEHGNYQTIIVFDV